MKPTIEKLILSVWTAIKFLFIVILFTFTTAAFLFLSIFDSFSVAQIEYLLMSFVFAYNIDLKR